MLIFSSIKDQVFQVNYSLQISQQRLCTYFLHPIPRCISNSRLKELTDFHKIKSEHHTAKGCILVTTVKNTKMAAAVEATFK